MRVHCKDCDWMGEQGDLINPYASLRDRYIEGECCPMCYSDETEDVIDEDE